MRGGDTTEKRIAFAYRHALNRQPLPEEMELLQTLVEKHLAHYQSTRPRRWLCCASEGALTRSEGVRPQELAAWTSVGPRGAESARVDYVDIDSKAMCGE